MKLLIRDSSNNPTWIDAVYEDGKFMSANKEESYSICRIYSIKDDNRNRLVKCSACEKEIRNTPAAIRAHQNMVNRPDKCFECGSLNHRDATIVSHKYVLNDDGTYSESTKRNVRLQCGKGWTYHDINSDSARRNCKYARCETATFKPLDDFWSKYPDAFDEFVTIDKIIEDGYKKEKVYSRYMEFELNSKPLIIAKVNNQGICYEVVLYNRRESHTLRYSKKYDKVFVEHFDDFKELSYLGLAQRTHNTVVYKLQTLYN